MEAEAEVSEAEALEIQGVEEARETSLTSPFNNNDVF